MSNSSDDSLPELSSDNAGSTKNSAPEVFAKERKQIGPYRILQKIADQSEYYDRLHLSHEKLSQTFETQKRKLEPHLSGVARAALEISRGKKPPEITLEIAQAANHSSWQRVASPKAFNSAPLTQIELVMYRELVQLHPLGIYYNTLATFEYRLGNHKESIAAAKKSIELTPKEIDSETPVPSEYAIVAMSHFKRGDKEKANEYRKKYDDTMKLDAFKNDAETRSFGEEVEALFDSSPSETTDLKENK